MSERIADIYKPPANVTIASAAAEVATAPRARLVSADLLMAGSFREQAAAIRMWALSLRSAEMRGDWKEVEAVRRDIASAAQELDGYALELEERARCRPRRG